MKFIPPHCPKVLAVAVAAGAIGWWCLGRQADPPPLQVSMWYWHSPFRIEQDEAKELKSMGVTELFVLDATVKGKAAPELAMRQRWKGGGDRLRVHLAFRFDKTAIEMFKVQDPAVLGAGLVPLIQSEIGRAKDSGIQFAGVQLDLDCPTRLLPRYAELVRNLRKGLKSPIVISATALESWYASRSLQPLADATDFLVPQCYEAALGKGYEEFRPISSPAGVDRVFERAPGLGKPFFVGLPVYGHAVVFDRRGRVAGMFRDMDAREALRSPSLDLQRAFVADRAGQPATSPGASVGEEMLDLRSTRPDSYGRGNGYHVVYLNPTPEMLRRSLAQVAKSRPASCRGVVLFRFPERGELSTLPLRSVRAVVQGKVTAPSLSAALVQRREPWQAIEGGNGPASIKSAIKLRIRNVGDASTTVRPDALEVILRFDQAGLSTLAASDFDEAVAGVELPGGSIQPSSLLRANVVRLIRYHCAAGESLGAILIRPSSKNCRIRGSWKAISCGEPFAGMFPEMRVGR
jgi:hypothetical protein